MVRSDALRNRGRVLDAARVLVARDGADVRMDAIAAQAGVAVGTLYRHFATKEALVAAVVEDSLEALVAQADQARADVEAGADPGVRLQELITSFAIRYGEDRALKAAASSLGADVHVDPTEGGTAAARALASVRQVLERAQRAGVVRDDVGVEDLVVLLGQLPDEQVAGPGSVERYLRVLLRGIRT